MVRPWVQRQDPELWRRRILRGLGWGVVLSLAFIGLDIATTLYALYAAPLGHYFETNPFYPFLKQLGPWWLLVNFSAYLFWLSGSYLAARRWWGPVPLAVCLAAVVLILPSEAWAVVSNLLVLAGFGPLPPL